MEIKILKNASNFDGIYLKDGIFLQKEVFDSEFDEIKQVRYYLNNIYTGERNEILPDINKYDIGRVILASSVNEYLYFFNLIKIDSNKDIISIIRYNYENLSIENLYSFEDSIEEYSKIVKFFKYSFTKNYNVGLVNPTYKRLWLICFVFTFSNCQFITNLKKF
jgi:hypothetical protein